MHVSKEASVTLKVVEPTPVEGAPSAVVRKVHVPHHPADVGKAGERAEIVVPVDGQVTADRGQLREPGDGGQAVVGFEVKAVVGRRPFTANCCEWALDSQVQATGICERLSRHAHLWRMNMVIRGQAAATIMRLNTYASSTPHGQRCSPELHVGWDRPGPIQGTVWEGVRVPQGGGTPTSLPVSRFMPVKRSRLLLP